MTIKEACNMVAQFNKLADALHMNGDGGKRARLYLVDEYSETANLCEYHTEPNYRRFKAYINETYINAAEILAHDFARMDEFETVPTLTLGNGWKLGGAARLCLSVEFE